MKSLVICVFAVVLLCVNAGSSSMSCSMVNGQWKCIQNSSPDGNMAAAGATSNGQEGHMAAGSGTPGSFNTNYGTNTGQGEPMPAGPWTPWNFVSTFGFYRRR
ncbi:uncharacterized protein LOC118197817 [Stegodyphus dumicola]|uniref:uncharacterized protein LOC118197817 n=1 Tax=Stegodyphus dumicola TaxID=202533 RepID=UPI0015AD8E69|nr:uncharacterized protein LOC118197817 [Stegodyphus dumicola]XP_035225245.1 uncharacterized protein LOC118197817 [Stegodyphus dumicola]